MRNSGFTLIELSIVLVIIGFLVGGIVAGRDLIDAAKVSAQISQVTKYNTAVAVFQAKYQYMPGDIPDPAASQFGFQARGQYQGTGNGDNIIAGGNGNCSGCSSDTGQGSGETVMFWVDLSKAGLIDGGFTTATSYTPPGADITGAAVGNYLPSAKIGQGNYVYVWAGGSWSVPTGWTYAGTNYYGISAVSKIAAASNYGDPVSTPGMTVQQAYNIDKKIDDGFPQSGTVIAVYTPVANQAWTDGTNAYVTTPPNTSATAGSPTTCYDNGNIAGTQKYSTEINNGAGLNCALSFQFQIQ